MTERMIPKHKGIRVKIKEFWKIDSKILLENAYLLLLGLFVADSFLHTTMFQIPAHVFLHQLMRIFLLMVIFSKTAVYENYNLKTIMFSLFLIFSFLVAYVRRSHYEILLDILLLIIGGNGVQLKKIIKVYFWVTLSLLLFTLIASQFGYVENLVYNWKNRRRRIAFGIIYPTDFASHVLYLIWAYIYLRKEKLRYLELIAFLGLGGFVYYFCDARTALICIVLTTVICFAMKKHQKYSSDSYLKRQKIFAMLITTVCCLTFLVLTLLYNPENTFMAWVNKLLNNRLKYGKQGVLEYGASKFGQYIPMIGAGGTVEKQADYFFLDSSYIQALLCYGGFVLIAILLIYIVIGWRAGNIGDRYLVMIIAMVSIQCMMEHHMLEYTYNPFTLAVFASLTKERKTVQELKICLVGSSGGHLLQMFMLRPFWENKERFWVTFDKEDARSLLEGEKMYSCYYPTNRNIKNLFKNTFVAIKVLLHEKPDVIISTGAAVAVPFFYIGKLLGKKCIYIEVYDRIDKGTLTGKLVYPISDVFIVQWEEQKQVYPKAINLGGIF